ncbi:MAG: hypothetical protein JST92_26895 [Deltaproteobacteria bacterium]|nr:hypothetical protein [Deltaproteobacteria bacterium]
MSPNWKDKLMGLGARAPKAEAHSKPSASGANGGPPDVYDIEAKWLADEQDHVDEEPAGMQPESRVAPVVSKQRHDPIVVRGKVPLRQQSRPIHETRQPKATEAQAQSSRPAAATRAVAATQPEDDSSWAVSLDILDKQRPSGSQSAPRNQKPSQSPPDQPFREPVVYRPSSLSRRNISLPEDARSGRECQHPSYGGQSNILQVRVGFDFGTAFSKVVLRVGDQLLAVDWRDALDEGRPQFFLPGIIHHRANGSYGWFGDDGSEQRSDLKLPLLDRSPKPDEEHSAIAFLALALRYARAFLYRHPEHGRRCASRRLAWEVNIGCPTKPHENHEVVERFRRIATAAWAFAAEDEITDVAIAEWLASYEQGEIPPNLEKAPDVLPEFVAQIATYLQSSQQQDGLHSLIDVGAATLDVATFNIVTLGRETEVARIPIFASEVQRLGTHFLLLDRHRRLDLEPSWDDAAPVESASKFALAKSCSLSRVAEVDREISQRVERVISGVLAITRTNRGDPKSDAWRNGIPLFFTGGGALVEAYRTAVVGFDGSKGRVRLVELRPGARRLSVPDSDYLRLTTAVGLTEDAEELAQIVPFRDIERLTTGDSLAVRTYGGAYGDGEPG